MSGLSFLWLEITGRCQLECVHCYADSGPAGTHGDMTEADWRRVIDDAASLGVSMVQFIGGEPTLHPGLPALIAHARAAGVEVEVFSNLVHITPALWEQFTGQGVRLACSYYSDDPGQHAAITGTRASHARTRANVAEALRRSIPLRVGVIDLGEGQRTAQAVAELESLGVTDIGTDRLRQVGRGIRDRDASVEQLCGNCGDGVLAVAADGSVWPCVFTRWMPIGNVLTTPLGRIAASETAARTRDELTAAFAARPVQTPCVPNMCDPQCGPSCGPACNPSCWPTKTGPCSPKGGCVPNYE